MKEYKLVVLGAGGVGKSALTVRYVQGIFVEKYDPTIEDTYRKQVVIDGETIMLEVLDTAGTEQFTSMRDLYIRNGHGFALVYCITAQSTFDDLDEIRQQIVAVKGEKNLVMVIVGNKCDLEEDRVVPREHGVKLAKVYSCGFYETSAKETMNVKPMFEELIRKAQGAILRTHENHKRKTTKCKCHIL